MIRILDTYPLVFSAPFFRAKTKVDLSPTGSHFIPFWFKESQLNLSGAKEDRLRWVGYKIYGFFTCNMINATMIKVAHGMALCWKRWNWDLKVDLILKAWAVLAHSRFLSLTVLEIFLWRLSMNFHDPIPYSPSISSGRDISSERDRVSVIVMEWIMREGLLL